MTQASMVAVDASTLKITLPDGMSVTPGKPVPPELLEVLAGYFSLMNSGALGGAEGCGSQSGGGGGCSVQLGAQ